MDKYEIVNLRERKEFLKRYVELRNRYIKELLTEKVTTPGTLKWIANTDVEIYGLVGKDTLLGVILVYIEKQGEVAFFAREPGKGYGSRLLKIANKIAKKRNLSYLRAWVNEGNVPAVRAFEKNGYIRQGVKIREYSEKRIKGFNFIKHFERRSI
jgi:GNAT superfamily N-acetyltransferase